MNFLLSTGLLLLFTATAYAQQMMSEADLKRWLPGKTLTYFRQDGQKVILTFNEGGTVTSNNSSLGRITLGQWKVDSAGLMCQTFGTQFRYCSFISKESGSEVTINWTGGVNSTKATVN